MAHEEGGGGSPDDFKDWNRRHFQGQYIVLCILIKYSPHSVMIVYHHHRRHFHHHQVCPERYQQCLILHSHIGGNIFSVEFCQVHDNLQTPSGRPSTTSSCPGVQGRRTTEPTNDAASTFPWPDDLKVMMDFELAMRQAWTHLHPSHNVRGCLFHLANVSPQILTHSNPPSIPIILATLEEGLRTRILSPLQRKLAKRNPVQR